MFITSVFLTFSALLPAHSATTKEFIRSCDEIVRSVSPNSVSEAHSKLEVLLKDTRRVEIPLTQDVSRNFLLRWAGLYFNSNLLEVMDVPFSQPKIDTLKNEFSELIADTAAERPHRPGSTLENILPRTRASGFYLLSDGSFAFVSNFGGMVSKVTCGLVSGNPKLVQQVFQIDVSQQTLVPNGSRVARITNRLWQPPYTYTITILDDEVAQAMDVPRVYVAMSGDPL